jgi:hypothetical protein
VAKKKWNHIQLLSVILPACCKIVNIMFGEEYEKEILKILMWDNTISRRIQDMSQDVESHLIADIKEADYFAFQLEVNWHHWKSSTSSILGLFVMETSLNNFYFANHSQK